MTDAAIIYRTHVEAIESLPEAEQLMAYKAIIAYCMDDVMPDDMIGRYTVGMAKPLLDKWKVKREAGAKGGSSSKQTEANASMPKQTEATESNPQPKVKVKVKEKVKDKKDKKHIYGEFKHVRLTDDEYNKLLDAYGEQKTAAGIKRVDEYCEETGKRYSNYYLVIQRWGVKTTTKREQYFAAGKHDDDGTDELKRKIIELAESG